MSTVVGSLLKQQKNNVSSIHLPKELSDRLGNYLAEKGRQIRACGLAMMYLLMDNKWSFQTCSTGVLCLTKDVNTRQYDLGHIHPRPSDSKNLRIASMGSPENFIKVADHFYVAQTENGSFGFSFVDISEAEKFSDKVKKTIKKIEKRKTYSTIKQLYKPIEEVVENGHDFANTVITRHEAVDNDSMDRKKITVYPLYENPALFTPIGSKVELANSGETEGKPVVFNQEKENFVKKLTEQKNRLQKPYKQFIS